QIVDKDHVVRLLRDEIAVADALQQERLRIRHETAVIELYVMVALAIDHAGLARLPGLRLLVPFVEGVADAFRERKIGGRRRNQRLRTLETGAHDESEAHDRTAQNWRHRFHRSTNGSRTNIVSSRSGLVESRATGAPINSSTRRIYLIAAAGSSAHERAPRVDSRHPGMVS